MHWDIFGQKWLNKYNGSVPLSSNKGLIDNHLCIVCRPGETFVHKSAECHPQGIRASHRAIHTVYVFQFWTPIIENQLL